MKSKNKATKAQLLKSDKLYNSALELAYEDNFDKKIVYEKLMGAASLGSHKAEYALATWYLHGLHLKKNIAKGTVLLKRAVVGGVTEACFDLAYSYEMGIGVKQNTEKAFQLYMEAALRGDEDSLTEVVRCLWHGIGVKRNRVLANLWRDMPSDVFRK